jgi:alpha-tubulin suppressor-like RCC1 family protein
LGHEMWLSATFKRGPRRADGVGGMPTLLKRLKELEDTLKPFQAETHPSWNQTGQIFNALLAEAQVPLDDEVIKAIKPVGEREWSRASGVTGAPVCTPRWPADRVMSDEDCEPVRRIGARWLHATATLGVVSACLMWCAGPATAFGPDPAAALSLQTLTPPLLLAGLPELRGGLAQSASAPAKNPLPFTVTLRASRAVVHNGRPAKLTGRVTPRAAHGRVELQVRAGGRWRTVASRSLSKASAFAFTTRLSGVGGHFVRVVKSSSSGHGQGVSNIVELIVPGRRTVRSHGGALHLSLGAVSVSAPKGVIARGQTLSIAVGAPTGFGSEGASSVSGGPYLLSTSQGEPHKPITVTISYDPGLLAPGDKPLLLHGWTVTHKWIPEVTTVHGSAHSVSATLDSFSPIDVIDWGTYYAGILTGNRAGLPTGCGPTPSWIDSVTLPDSNQDPLPACFSTKSDQTEAVLNVVNNRGYAQTVTVYGAKIDVAKSSFASSFEGQIGKLLAQLSSGNGPSAFVLGPGEGASVTIDRPPPQLAALEIHIDPAAKTASGVGELAWALLTTAKDQIGVPLNVENCVMAAVYNTVSADRGPDSAIAQMHSCVDAAATGTAKGVLEKLAYGLLVDDFFYKIIDLEGDELYPAQIGFTIPGSNPTFTNPNIHVGPANYGTLPDGTTTIEHLTASGGTPPYRYYIWNEPENAAKVPSWVTLASDGTLTIEPPASASGEVSFYVYAFDSKGEHSPFKRDQVSFQTVSGGGGGGKSGATQVTAGGAHTCALLTGGGIDCWGANALGTLGNGTNWGPETCRDPCSTTPVAVSGISTATQVAAGGNNTCALLTGGSVDCWGENEYGQLGDGTNTGPESCYQYPCSTTPVAVGGITDAVQIAAGELRDTCALRAGGTVDCWGWNQAGQLGDGTNTGPESCSGNPCSTKPVAVSGITNAVQISVGIGQTCAVLRGGGVDCWGANDAGQLGDGPSTGPEPLGGGGFSSTPVAVSGITEATQVATGYDHTCALLASGSVDCWGEAIYFGNGDPTGSKMETCSGQPCSTKPVSVTGITGATQIDSQYEETCVVLKAGGIECWGFLNDYGQLGDGTTNLLWVPVGVGGITNATQATTAPSDACALLATGSVMCWGRNEDGQLGDGTNAGPETCGEGDYPEPCSRTPVAVRGIP